MIVKSYGENLGPLEPGPTGPTPGDISFADKQFGAPHSHSRGQPGDITVANNSAGRPGSELSFSPQHAEWELLTTDARPLTPDP